MSYRSIVQSVVAMAVTGLALGLSASATASMIPTVGFTAISVSPNQRGDASNAIDGNTTITSTFLTISGTSASTVVTVLLDLGSAADVIGLRIRKVSSDADGTGSFNDPYDLVFQASTTSTSTPLGSRTFTNVADLTNGVGGQELFTFASGSVDPANAKLINEDSDGVAQAPTDGWHSVTFDTVSGATALAFTFQNKLSSGGFSNYNVYEIEAIVPEPASMGLLSVGALAGLWRRNRRNASV